MEFLTIQWMLKNLWQVYPKESPREWSCFPSMVFVKVLAELRGRMDIFIILTVVIVLHVCTYVGTYQVVNLKYEILLYISYT